jgi:hypothetical protein
MIRGLGAAGGAPAARRRKTISYALARHSFSVSHKAAGVNGGVAGDVWIENEVNIHTDQEQRMKATDRSQKP